MMTNDVEHLFMCLLAIPISSLVKRLLLFLRSSKEMLYILIHMPPFEGAKLPVQRENIPLLCMGLLHHVEKLTSLFQSPFSHL